VPFVIRKLLFISHVHCFSISLYEIRITIPMAEPGVYELRINCSRPSRFLTSQAANQNQTGLGVSWLAITASAWSESSSSRAASTSLPLIETTDRRADHGDSDNLRPCGCCDSRRRQGLHRVGKLAMRLPETAIRTATQVSPEQAYG